MYSVSPSKREIPRRAQRAGCAVARGAKLRASAGDRAHGAVRERDGADGVVAGVGDVERLVAEGEALRISEGRRVAVGEAGISGADDALDAHAAPILLEASHEQAMMAGVGDGDAIAANGDLAGKCEAVGWDRWACQRRGASTPRAACRRARLGEHTLDERRHGVGGELARTHPDDRASWIDGDERRPGAHGIGAPDAELPIVQDGMRRVESDGRVTNALADPLGGVLPAVHADHGDRIAEPLARAPATAEAHGCS